MNMFSVQVSGTNPARYRGLLGATESEAISKAQERHIAAGFPLAGNAFKVTHSRVLIDGAAVEQPADTARTLYLNDNQLAEVEEALRMRTLHLESRVEAVQHRSPITLRAYKEHLKNSRETLALVTAV
jgi:hypothetical protein